MEMSQETETKRPKDLVSNGGNGVDTSKESNIMGKKNLQSNALQDKIEDRRSKVRVGVTYGAAWFIFLGGLTLIIGGFFAKPNFTIAKDVFTSVLPIATGIVTYWFASRKPRENS